MIVFSSEATCVAGLLDAVDGHAARLLGQSSKFGAMLDMLTDRCATMCLLTTLATFYPAAIFLFQLSMVIDISCHWLHIHTALLQGATSHKFVDPTGNYWMRLYYTDRRVLFAMCAGNGRTAASYFAVAAVSACRERAVLRDALPLPLHLRPASPLPHPRRPLLPRGRHQVRHRSAAGQQPPAMASHSGR